MSSSSSSQPCSELDACVTNPFVLRSDCRQRTVVTSPSRRKLPSWRRRRAVTEGNLRRLGSCAWLLKACYLSHRAAHGTTSLATLSRVQQIRDAILAGDTTGEEYAALEVPESYRGVTVHKDEVGVFEGLDSKDKDPRKTLHVDDVPVPELGPGEALVAVMASAINYNTVWTSIFEPVSTFGFLERYGRLSPLSKRHDLPYHVVGSDLAGVVLRTGPGRAPVAAGRRGRRPLPERRAGEPGRPQRHDARPGAADLGLRDQLRGPRRAGPGQVQPADAQARPPHLGGGRLTRPGQLHGVPPARQPQRRRHEAGRQRLDLGRQRGSRRLRHAVRPQRRRDAGLRGLQRREGRHLPGDGRRAHHQPVGEGLPVLEGRGHTRTPPSGGGSATTSAS